VLTASLFHGIYSTFHLTNYLRNKIGSRYFSMRLINCTMIVLIYWQT